MGRFQYSQWDGTQEGFDVDGDSLLGELADDVLYHGDLAAAIRRALQTGFADRDGRRVPGLRELLEQLTRRRRAELETYNLDGVYDDIARELRAVVDMEREALDGLDQSGATTLAADRRQKLDLLPPDLAGQVRTLEQYPFTSEEARRRFSELVDTLRRQLMANQFDQVAGSMGVPSAAEAQRLKDMFAALNQILDRRAGSEAAGRGRPPTEQAEFEAFMGTYGDLFPGRPATLDELLEQLARQMAAMQSLVNSMTPEQRAELQALSDQVLADMDLRWQVEQLGAHLRAGFPELGWERSFDLRGTDPLDLGQAVGLMDRLTQLDQLEHLLRSALSPASLADVDMDVARELLGDGGVEALERLSQLTSMLQASGLIDQREGRLELTPRGVRRLGQRALADLFGRLSPDRLGGHQLARTGAGVEPTSESKPYEYGDPFHLDIERTVRNAVHRAGGGVPVRLDPSDFEVAETETLTRSSTVVALDLSLSMPMRDNFLAAKKVAIALHALISSRFPKDFLGLVGFSEVARPLRPEQLPEVSWDFVWGTNLQHALQVSRRMLAGQPGSRQIILVTDGEPTAHVLPDGEVFFHYPPAPETIRKTLAEVARCTTAGIRINTFMLDADDGLQSFIDRLARMNHGRVFSTTPETLGGYVLVDYLDHKRARRRRAG